MLTPRKIAGKAVTIKKGAVNNEIPLLLSKESMKCAGPKIDFLGDKVNIFGNDINFTSSGHYAISLHDRYEGSAFLDDSRFIEVFLAIDNLHVKQTTQSTIQIFVFYLIYSDEKNIL